MRKALFGAVALLTLLAVNSLALIAIVSAAPPSDATMQFGLPDVGSGQNNPPAGEFHDQSWRAEDTIVPGAVAIAAGGSVDFNVEGFHQVVVYKPGKGPKDVTVDPGAFPFVNDPAGVYAQGLPAQDLDGVQFDEPGKYLVICNIAPHFEEARMWGWVTVK